LVAVDILENGDGKPAILPRGAVLGGLAIAFVAAGLWRVDGVLAALGLATGSLLALSWLLARGNAAGLEVKLHGPERVIAGAVFPLVVTVANRRRRLDAFALRIELEVAQKARTGGRAAWISAGSAADLELRVAVPERVRVETQRVRLVSDFPLGLFETRRTLDVACPLSVLPRPRVPRGLAFSGGWLDSDHADASAAGEAPGEIRGLRPWRAGDAPGRILWPASLRSMARGAGMIVRECDPPGMRPEGCAVVFHSYGGAGGLIRPDRFEKALSLAAGTLRHLHEQGIAARWIADFDGWRSRPARTRAQLAACMEMMARARRAGDSEAHDLQAALADLGPHEGMVVISDMPVEAWRAALPKRKQLPFLVEIPSGRQGMEVAR
jgi:uncharacterized protein (DUF58 family)